MADGPARKLVLLRHAKSAWPDVPDYERPLARRGQRDAPVMGRWLRAAGHVPDQVPVLHRSPGSRDMAARAGRAPEPLRRSASTRACLPGLSHAASGRDPPCAPGGEDAADRGPRSRNPGTRAHAGGRRLAGAAQRAVSEAASARRARPHAGQVPHGRHRGPRGHRELGSARLRRSARLTRLRDPSRPGRTSQSRIESALAPAGAPT